MSLLYLPNEPIDASLISGMIETADLKPGLIHDSKLSILGDSFNFFLIPKHAFLAVLQEMYTNSL